MYDGFKCCFKNKLLADQLNCNPLLDFVMHVNKFTGEVLCNTAKNFKGLTIKTYISGRIEIKGSLHKYANEGFHNYDDFTIQRVAEVLSMMHTELGIDPKLAIISNLEFGLNLKTSFDPNDFIYALLCYKWKQFNVMEIVGQGYGKECKAFKQYFVKIYNKSLQYYLPDNILRVEKKVVTMCALKFGKLYLADLTNPNLWEHCKQQLITMLSDVLVNEPIEQQLKDQEQRTYNLVTNQRNWIKYTREEKRRYKRAFNKITASHGKHAYNREILNLISCKSDELNPMKVNTFL